MSDSDNSIIKESEKDQIALADAKKASKRKLIWGLICLIGPTALILLSIVVYAIINFVVASSPDLRGGELFDDSPIRRILNIFMFSVSAIAFLTWLPGIIVGVILLATRK